eukprot:6199270-Pleurochrysis_carterae.AAC.1
MARTCAGKKSAEERSAGKSQGGKAERGKDARGKRASRGSVLRVSGAAGAGRRGEKRPRQSARVVAAGAPPGCPACSWSGPRTPPRPGGRSPDETRA